MNMEYASSTVVPIPRTVSESALTPLFNMGVGGTLSLRRPGSIKKGNRKSEILLRDAEVGVAPNFDLVWPFVSDLFVACCHACIHLQEQRVQVSETEPRR
jgi:hypothetical protein